jgi:hypothetical protein
MHDSQRTAELFLLKHLEQPLSRKRFARSGFVFRSTELGTIERNEAEETRAFPIEIGSRIDLERRWQESLQ